jgi:hypothetical protein
LLKETKAADDIHADATIDDHPKEAVDAEVMRITNENLVGSEGLDIAETVPGASMDSTDQAEETKV